MGRKRTKRKNRLGRLAAGFAAATVAILPGLAASASVPLPENVEAEARNTSPARLVELASTYPQQVLSNRVLRRLRVEEPDTYREIVLAARFGRAEIRLAEAIARAPEATLRVFACDCASRVAPLYERVAAGSADLIGEAREHSLPATQTAFSPGQAGAAARRATAAETAFIAAEARVAAFERTVKREAYVSSGATGALRRLVFDRCEKQVPKFEGESREAVVGEPSFRLLAVAMPAAEAIDEALVIAAGGDLQRISSMCEAIAHAVYLENAFSTGQPQQAIEAVFRELAWQRTHLLSLQLS